MKRYNPSEIEPRWQKTWAEKESFKAVDLDDKRPKMYLAEMFPYPSAAGLHVGHVRNFTIVDVLSRFYAQQGYNVLRPFGYDTFGLPAENYAIQHGISPQKATEDNIANFRKQAKRLGYAIDWSREISSSDPEYYKWTQWVFSQLYKKGLAYKQESYQWWCDFDKTVLANEQVESGKCWRCGHEVEKKKMSQWYFKITAYADELLDELEALDWPEKIKTMQRNWIGRSVGAEVDFKIAKKEETIKVFTTRPDTLFGATFLVLAPEHVLVSKITTKDRSASVDKYRAEAMRKSEIERQENKDKTGVFTGAYAINPVNDEKVPIWIADYVLMGYGTGAIMAVPAHDERDFEFAKKFDIPIKQVIVPNSDEPLEGETFHGDGVVVNSGEFDGLASAEMRETIIKWLVGKGVGREKVQYKMRDWLISRQRYWGCPIPVAYDKKGKIHLIPDDRLPVLLPKVEDYKPDDSGRSALAKAKDWLKVEVDGEEMVRETDTLDGYACSSWYLLRYCDPHNGKEAWDKKLIDFWNPVDVYVGADHAVAHLLYVRFWCKVFADLGLVNFREPVKKLIYHGYINGEDNKKMSKSKGNTIDPLDIIDSGYGADTLRTYEMFIAPIEMDAPWSTAGVGGVYRFLNRVWNLVQNYIDQPKDVKSTEIARLQNKTIKKVTQDLRRQGFNTAVAALMEYLNGLTKLGTNRDALVTLLKLLAPFAPHIASELLEELGVKDLDWPKFDKKLAQDETVTIGVQVNGKVRGDIEVSKNTSEDAALKLAKKQENVAAHLKGKAVVKVIYVPGRILNVIVK